MRSWSATFRASLSISFGLALGLGVCLGAAGVVAVPDSAVAAPRQKLVCPKTLAEPGAFADAAEHARYAACLRQAQARRARAAARKQVGKPAETAAAAAAAAAAASPP